MKTTVVKVVHGKPGLMPRIPSLWAFLAVDADGDEGVASFYSPGLGAWMPMVAADEARLESLKEVARQMASAGTKIRMVKFHGRVDVREFQPEEGV